LCILYLPITKPHRVGWPTLKGTTVHLGIQVEGGQSVLQAGDGDDVLYSLRLLQVPLNSLSLPVPKTSAPLRDLPPPPNAQFSTTPTVRISASLCRASDTLVLDASLTLELSVNALPLCRAIFYYYGIGNRTNPLADWSDDAVITQPLRKKKKDRNDRVSSTETKDE
jgi:hypothetical protein